MYSKLAIVAVVLIAAVGVYADEYNCAAEGKVCQNGGVCHDTVQLQDGVNPGSGGNGYQTPFCICQAPWGGPDCSYKIRECKDNPCQNGATCNAASCQQGVGSRAFNFDCFTCTCAKGWSGGPSAPASNPGGVCDWPLRIRDCTTNGCDNGGNCTSVAPFTSYSCACPVDFWGAVTPANSIYNSWHATNCSVPRCTRPEAVCLNGGSCVNGGSTGMMCSCTNGFWGDRCENAPPCNSNPCSAGATCNNGANGAFSCTPLPFCSTHTCLNGGTCSNPQSRCNCLAPFDGLLSCNATQFCQSSPCLNGGTCTNLLSAQGGTGTCTCPKGWVGDFCEIQLNGCGRDTVGCSPMSQPCACTTKQTCQNQAYDTKCYCNDPSNNPGNVYSYDCRCNSTAMSRCPGNVGVPGMNVDMVCQNGGSCVETSDAAFCRCRPGFWGDKCQNYDNPCLNSPCQNGGQCWMTGETSGLPGDDRFWAYRCRCKWPFYGKNCDKMAPISTDGTAPIVCSGSPCQNGGTCGANVWDRDQGNFLYQNPLTGHFDEAEPWKCTCQRPTPDQDGFVGQMCENRVERCTATTCGVGHCFNSGNVGVSCTCPCGYAGDRCEVVATNINANSVAQFAGDGQGGVGYRLEFCSREPCQNGGTCYHTPTGQSFFCNCPSGFAGTYCQNQVRSSAAGLVPSLIAVAAAVAAAFALKN